MGIQVFSSDPINLDCDILFCFLEESANKILGISKTTSELDRVIKNTINENGGKFARFSSITTMDEIKSKKIVIVGIGKKENINNDTFRILSGKITRYSIELEVNSIGIVIPEKIFDKEMIENQVVEGFCLSQYKFDRFKTENKSKKITLVMITERTKDIISSIKKAEIVSDSVNYARSIANLPPNECSPDYLARMAKKLSVKNKMKCKILSKIELEKSGFGGISAVGRGSKNEPKLIIIENLKGPKNEKPIVVVGKAVTFDTGGISLKPGDKMDEMKFDKCGGCTVLGIMKAVSELKLAINIVGIIPSVENMPSGDSYRPGDIIKLYNGKTAEILNTDAEGRLILADAISFGEKKYNPRKIFDFATLTGACIVALGTNVAAMITNEKKLASEIMNSATRTSESVWELPINEDYMDMIKSEVADMKNTGIGRVAGTITAAAFLKNAIESTPWVHFDIAGVAWTQVGTKEKSYISKGATGFGVRLMIDHLTQK